MDTSAAVPTSSASPMAAAHGGGSPGTPSSAGENSTGGESLGIKMRGRIAHSITEMSQKNMAKIAQKADGNLELQQILMDAGDEVRYPYALLRLCAQSYLAPRVLRLPRERRS